MHFSASTFLVSYFNQNAFVEIMHFFDAIWGIKFSVRLASELKKNNAETAPSNSAILDKFIEQHQHQNIKKYHI